MRSLRRIALHAAWVRVQLNPHEPPWEIGCPLPADMRETWSTAGGELDALAAAVVPLP
ncbi:MAG: hypothetical protein MUF54_16500 [Polyangiaceae bacterium]|nr:hypothetical protein [Polyangiaceae bacterium]